MINFVENWSPYSYEYTVRNGLRKLTEVLHINWNISWPYLLYNCTNNLR